MRQEDVLNLLRERGPMSAAEVGDVLSRCCTRDARRTDAGDTLNRLWKHQEVRKVWFCPLHGNPFYIWSVVE